MCRKTWGEVNKAPLRTKCAGVRSRQWNAQESQWADYGSSRKLRWGVTLEPLAK